MFGIPDKIAAMIGGGLSIVLAASLLFVIIGKNGEISALGKQLDKAQADAKQSAADYAQCKANRLTLEDATARQNAAVKAATDAVATRLDTLGSVVARAGSDAAQAKAGADRILGTKGSGDACRDADALILEVSE